MNALPRIAAVLVTLALSACASAPIVPMEGSMEDLSDLAGEWSGTYLSPELGRAGTVWFKLTPGETYGLVAYLLFLNRIVPESAVMDARTLPQVVMPARDRFVRDNRTGGKAIK